ncbi:MULTISPECIES: hypothetical protein [Burkholderia cepacia complex]|nr:MULTISPECIES: hypothetical protein [Burkholderia cepacia complex]MCW3498713.1 hypothetical protein [Burkholderia cenocepacia]MCW3506199.1 hypothetical protein [Burkholderia cenocepacia]MCW3513866.1 hypothetical protein [Burkholderia cenocepacia]MCW3529016.1 hypothetical protein [Burkholderia cenocepacia]MCW3544650.1 hypothetical protein [Burkholderia cenocepacia]
MKTFQVKEIMLPNGEIVEVLKRVQWVVEERVMPDGHIEEVFVNLQ